MSGQIIAQNVQPMHSPPVNTAGFIPFLFSFSSFFKSSLGHTLMQSKQPLHLSLSIFICAIYLLSFKYFLMLFAIPSILRPYLSKSKSRLP